MLLISQAGSLSISMEDMKIDISMSRFFITGLVISCFIVSARADDLPTIKDAPVHGCFFLISDRSYDFTVDYKGRTKLFFKKKRSKERVGQDYTVLVYTEVEYKDESGKVTKKKLDDDSFSVATEPQLGQTQQSYDVAVTGGAKVQVSMKHDEGRILLHAKIVDKGDLTDGELSVGFRVVVPKMYTSSYNDADKRKLRDKMRRDSFRITRAADGDVLSLKSYELADLRSDEMAGGGFTSLTSEMGAQEGKKITFTTFNGKDSLIVTSKDEQESMLWTGYTVYWKSGGEDSPSSPLVIQVK